MLKLSTLFFGVFGRLGMTIFSRNNPKPSCVFACYNALMQENKLQETIGPQDQVPQFPVNNQATLQSRFSVQALSETAGTIVCCDAAWKMDLNKQPTQAGIGVYIKLENNQHCKHIYIAALSPPATSPLQAEAFAFAFGTKIADGLQLQQPQFFTDCKVLATAILVLSMWHFRNSSVVLFCCQ